MAAGDGALGFWAALDEVYPDSVHQRCWFHKMGNVLTALPKRLQVKRKADPQAIWMAASRQEAAKTWRWIRAPRRSPNDSAAHVTKTGFLCLTTHRRSNGRPPDGAHG